MTTISIAPHPSYFNRALRSLGVTDVEVAEKPDGRMHAIMGNDGTAQLVNAIAVAYAKLIAAESQIGALGRVRTALGEVKGTETHGYADVDDAIEDVESVISNLTRISAE